MQVLSGVRVTAAAGVLLMMAGLVYAGDIEFEQSIKLDAATTLEAQLTYTADFTKPLGGSGMLTEGNEVAFKLQGIVNPVSLSAAAKVVYTPLAIVQLEAGGTAGSGWYLDPVSVNGIGVLQDTAANEYSQDAFAGAVLEAVAGGAFQFDTGAVLPGDWSSVLMRSYHGVQFDWHTLAGNTPFEYMGVKDRLNGWSYHTDSVLGYQLHAVPVLQLVGVLFDSRTLLDRRAESPVAEGGWGSDFVQLNLGGLAALAPLENHSIILLAQWSRSPDWTNADQGLFARSLDPDSPAVWEFWRVALSYTLQL